MKDIEILKRIILEIEDETSETKVVAKNLAFEEDPMGYILKKYSTLNSIMTELMTKDFRQFVDAIFYVAPKPSTFKIMLHNGQEFFMTYMKDDIYQAIVSGKRYYLSGIGEKERCMMAISKLLRFGSPLKPKEPEEAEQGTRDSENTGMEGDWAEKGGATGGAAPESGGETDTTAAGEESGGEELKESIEILKRILIKEARGGSELFNLVRKQLENDKYKVALENKGNRGLVLRTNFETSKNVQGLIEKIISKIIPKDSFKVQEFQKNQGESKSSTYPTYKVELIKRVNDYKKGESVFIVSTVKEGASTKGKALTPAKLGLTTTNFTKATLLAETIKKNIPNVTNDENLKDLLDSLVDDVLAGAATGEFKNTAKITKYDQQISLSERTKSAISQVSTQDIGIIGSDFGECLGAIALLKSVVDPGSGITFPADEANPLADFTINGYNVSSKYNKGGAATITDTVKNIDEKQLTTDGEKFLYKLLKDIVSKDAVNGPLEAAKTLELEGLQKLSEIIKVPVENISIQNINEYLTKILKSATSDEQKDAIIKKKFASFYKFINKAPGFPIRWRDLSPKDYYGIITSPLVNYVAASLNANEIYKKALTDIMSKTEVKQLYLTMNIKQNTARFNLKSFSSSEFEFESSLSIYKPKNKRLAFRML
jgi:hypothetical protein